MAKLKKIFSIIALTIFSLTFLVGCGLFVLNEDRYRDQQAMTIGTEVVTLGEVIDFFQTNGIGYIQQGQDIQQVWDSIFPAFVQQKVLISEFKLTFDGTKNNSQLAKKYKNGEYLTDETLNYIIHSVYVSFYQTLDEMSLKNLSANFNFEDAKPQDSHEMINKGNDWSPADADNELDDAKLLKEMEKYNSQDYVTFNYVFKEGDEKLAETVKNLNDRLKKDKDTDPDLTGKDYIKAQNEAVSTTTRNLKNNKDMTLDQFFKHSVEEQILTRMASEYTNKLYNNYQTTVITQAKFEERLNNLTNQMKASYAQNNASFEQFITSMNDDSFVYFVPAEYQGEYHYVRSVLLPFSDEQTKLLNQAKTQYGANSATYKDYRQSLANDIEVKDFTNNDKGVATEIDTSTLFGATPTFNGVALSSATKQNILDWTYAYNTDPGMLNPVHSYVISKSASNMTGSNEKFVPEFVAGARELANDPSKNAVPVVTDYGIHIIYYDGEVVADTITWDDRNNYGIEGGSASYRFYKAFYTEMKNVLASAEMDSLYKKYSEGEDSNRKIVLDEKVLSSYTKTIKVTL